jgi:hypothetical protein
MREDAMRKTIAALFAAGLMLAGCATHDDYGRSGRSRYYAGGDYDRLGNDCGAFGGSGARLLDPWLACTEEGENLVRSRFDRGHNGRISRATADRANIWFRLYADQNHNKRLTDPEIKAALVTHALYAGGGR